MRERAAAARAHVARVRQPGEGLAHEAPLAAAVVGQHARLAVLQLALAARAAARLRRRDWTIKRDHISIMPYNRRLSSEYSVIGTSMAQQS